MAPLAKGGSVRSCSGTNQRTGTLSDYTVPSLCQANYLPAYYLQILHNLIMFESAGLADHLCDLNGLDRNTLQLHALDLGIK